MHRRTWPLALITLCLSSLFRVALAQQPETRSHDIVPEDYFDIGTIREMAVSPEGEYVAYVESRWGRGKEGRMNDLWVVEVGSGERLRLSFDGFGASHPVWSPAGEWIYFKGRSKRGSDEKPPHDGKTQVWRVAPGGGELFPVTRAKKGVGDYELAADGRTLYYTTSEEVYADEWKALRKEYSDLEYGHGVSDLSSLWKLDLVAWRSEEVLAAKRVIQDMALSPDGERIAMITTSDNELIVHEGWSQVEVLELASGKVRTLTSQQWRSTHPSPYGWLEGVCWSPDSQALAFSISFDGYASRIWAAELGSGEGEPFEVVRPELVSFAGGLSWQPGSRTLCFLAEARACVRVCAIEEVRGGSQGAASTLTPGEIVVNSFGFDASGASLAVVMQTTTHLRDLFLVASDDYQRITDVNPQVAEWKVPQISKIQWTGADGDEVEGILELPPGHAEGDGPLPLVVELHGGPTDATKYRLRLWIYGRALMPAKGYALLSPNYHGSTGYGDEFLEKLIGRENDIEVIDIRAGIQTLIDRGIADPERIGVMGWSNGGFLTNSMITAEPDLFKAASSGAGVLDMSMQWSIEDTPGHVVNYMEGLPWEKPEAYIKGSPLYQLDKVKTPTIIHVGGDDPRVPPQHSRALYRALYHYLDVPVELVVYPGEGHGLSSYDNRMAKMKWDLAWFDRYLLGKVKADG